MPGLAEKHATRPPEVQAFLDALAQGQGPHAYASLLGLRTYDTAGLHQRVKEGLSFAALERLRKAMDLPAHTIAAVLHIPLRTLQRRKGEVRLRPDESDRVVRLARLFGGAIQLFEGDAAAARAWLESPLAALGGSTPLDLAQTEPGAGEVEALIGRLEHGVFT
jgi:putative toxin-antitoxin system antitoxin component (TIGR02293 family)